MGRGPPKFAGIPELGCELLLCTNVQPDCWLRRIAMATCGRVYTLRAKRGSLSLWRHPWNACKPGSGGAAYKGPFVWNIHSLVKLS